MLTPFRLSAGGPAFVFFVLLSTSVLAQNPALQSIAEELKMSKSRAKRNQSAATAPASAPPSFVPRQFDATPQLQPQPSRLHDPFEQMSGGSTPEVDQGIRYEPEITHAPHQQETPSQRFKRELQADARLYDICFTDAQNGYAVGDRGTIWKTVDGGRNWTLTETPVDCPLYGVSFTDPMRGVAVGGFRKPFLNKCEGVILKTDDGGENWTRIPTPFLPTLRRVKMENRSYGWAAGDSTAMSQGGLFQTNDGGRSWSPLPGSSNVGWNDFRFLDPQTGAGLASDGSLRVLQGAVRESNHLPLGLRRPVALDVFLKSIPGAANGWLVGEGGLVLNSYDHGEQWQNAATPLPGNAASLFDFQTVFARENNVWIAGTPGSIVFYSKDAGRTWNTATTGITTPIREIRFFDATRGYAVGDLGTILETLDGGVHWTVQRLGGSRLAMLGVAMKSEEIPLETIVQYGEELGYLCGVEILSQSDENPIEAVHEAVVRCGGIGASQSWGFSLDPAETKMPIGKVVQRIERENGGKGLLRFRQNLVRNLRMWKPNVVLTSDSRSGDTASRQFLSRELSEAIRAAADPNIFPEQIHEAGLTPWKTGKLYLVSGEFQGEINLDSTEYATRIGRSLDELTFKARGLIQPNPTQWSARTGFQPLLDDFAGTPGMKNDLFSGVAIAPGTEARRVPLGNNADQAEMNRRRAQRRHQILQLCDQATQNSSPDSNLNTIAILGGLLGEMEPDRLPEMLLEIALRFQSQNRWNDTESIFVQMVEQFPQHPYSVVALQWLIRYDSSEEIRWWTKRKLGLDEMNPIDSADQQRREMIRVESAKQFAQLLKMYGPEEFSALQIKPKISVAQIPATKSQVPPYLDGLFDEELDRKFWFETPIVSFTPKSVSQNPQTGPIALASARTALESQETSDLGTQAMFRYDDDNLYVALRCRKSNEFTYPPPDDSPRPRDPDLTNEDRVEIFLDTDRDGVTFFKLTVDYRGWVADECCGDKSWNPAWYVAREEDEHYWMIEAAIPLDQLTEFPPSSETAWGISLRRIVPGVGLEICNSGNRDQTGQNGKSFGLLQFD